MVVGAWAPASGTLPDGTTVDVETDYPFGDTATVTVRGAKATPVSLRIPSWATAATVDAATRPHTTHTRPQASAFLAWDASLAWQVDGQPAANGSMWSGVAAAGGASFKVDFAPSVRLEAWDNGTVSVHRGALLH